MGLTGRGCSVGVIGILVGCGRTVGGLIADFNAAGSEVETTGVADAGVGVGKDGGTQDTGVNMRAISRHRTAEKRRMGRLLCK